MTSDQIAVVKRLRREGLTVRAIARATGTSKSSVQRAVPGPAIKARCSTCGGQLTRRGCLFCQVSGKGER